MLIFNFGGRILTTRILMSKLRESAGRFPDPSGKATMPGWVQGM